jgi:hypothetical protein
MTQQSEIIKVEEVTFSNYATEKEIAVNISFPYADQAIFDSIEVSDDIDNYFFEQAEKGNMSGEKEIYCRRNDSDFTMKWEITVYCDAEEYDDEE